ncbi:MTOR-associated protein MEAK7 [Periplaneta americana]|uniref:MTOR-associated protein MEAK7 n=1 Tax=Periplaneta americana TaxID=6978 RepID=UPI0037E8F172
MGNNKGKIAENEEDELSHDERQHVHKLFKSIFHTQEDERHKENLTKHWGDQMDKRLLALFEGYVLEDNSGEAVAYDKFKSLYINLAVHPSDEKATFVIQLLKSSKQKSPTYDDIVEYVESVISSYVTVLTVRNNIVLKSWKMLGMESTDERQKLMAEALCRDLKEKGSIEDNFGEWFGFCSQFHKMQVSCLQYLYNIPQKQVAYAKDMADHCLFPKCFGVHQRHTKNFPSIMKLSDVLFLNSFLPAALQMEWRFCFSTELHGLSFSKMLGLIINQGPCIIILRDKSNHVFGGFASDNFILSPEFHGDSSSFLFQLCPEMRICESTGYNNHYQYLNVQQQTMPNGLAMGGQFDYCGIWIDAEFGKGHCSESCTTFKNYTMLSGTKHFDIEQLEVWAVGPEPEKEELEDAPRTIREREVEAKAVLELAGRKMYSEDLEDEEKLSL